MSSPLQAHSSQPDSTAGPVTLLMTDMEGSSERAASLGEAWPGVLDDHRRLIDAAADQNEGREVDRDGDGCFYSFAEPQAAVAAAATLQRSLQGAAWPKGATIRVRVGIHTGEPFSVDGRYAGLDVHRAARICAAGTGGQVLVSRETVDLCADAQLPEGCTLRGLGSFQLRGIEQPVELYELDIAGVEKTGSGVRSDEPAVQPVAAPSDVELAQDFPPRKGAAVGVLGAVTGWKDGAPIELSASGLRRMLAVFALRPLDVLSIDTLIDQLWPDDPPKTATQTVHVYVSRLRKQLGDVITTVPGGYRLALPPAAIDLNRFETLWDEGRAALDVGDTVEAADLLRRAGALWRGAPLPELVYEGEFSHHAERLAEMRLACDEDRIDADLALGRHARVVSELDALTRTYPLRERLHGQLMLALYRSGRQADALEVFRTTRERMLDELGIEPGQSLVDLNRRMLQQDASLELTPTPTSVERRPQSMTPRRSLLVVSQASSDVDELVSVLAPLVSGDPDRELILARIVEPLPGQDVSSRLQELRRRLGETRDRLASEGVSSRIAVFASRRPQVEVDRLADQEQAELVILDGAPMLRDNLTGFAGVILEEVAADVALLVGDRPVRLDRHLMVPFSGTPHDWAALELAAWAARSARVGVRLVGAEHGDRDASGLLAGASLVVQRMVGIDVEPALVSRGVEGLLGEAAEAAAVFTGLAPDWQTAGLGEVRAALATRCEVPLIFTRRGSRPSAFAPASSATRFTWTLTRHA